MLIAGEGGGMGRAVLNFASAEQDPAFNVTTSYGGFVPGTQVVGVQNLFTWTPLQNPIAFWPDGYEYGFHTVITDLSGCGQLKNGWFVSPNGANPDINIRVMASLDFANWSYVTYSTGDWRTEGANVNGGGWLTYTEEGDPYQIYPPYVASRAGVDNAFPGGWIESGWQPIKEEFRVEDVMLRWSVDYSHNYSDDPIYDSISFFAVGYGEIRAR